MEKIAVASSDGSEYQVEQERQDHCPDNHKHSQFPRPVLGMEDQRLTLYGCFVKIRWAHWQRVAHGPQVSRVAF